MRYILFLLLITLLFQGCSKEAPEPTAPKEIAPLKPLPLAEISESNATIPFCDENLTKLNEASIMFDDLPNTYLIKSNFEELPNWHEEDYTDALNNFLNSCKTRKTRKLYKSTCKEAALATDAKLFMQKKFNPYKINTKDGKKEGLLTGYYEPHLRGSLKRTKKYKYPIYQTPQDLIIVDLSSIYPKLKNYRLRGKLDGNRLVPYDTRKESNSKHIPAKVICFTDSKIDLFFLEIQGSGRVSLRSGKTMFIGYDNQNGHKYRAIGRYLVKIGALELQEVSLQTIRGWLERNPLRVDEVLNYNKSVVYFKERKQSASGSLGLCLTPSRSIAVDRRYIPLGSMLYLNADVNDKSVSKIVLAQDTGGAIKGAIRADMFLGFGKDAMNTAGELKSPLKLWILLPKSKQEVEL